MWKFCVISLLCWFTKADYILFPKDENMSVNMDYFTFMEPIVTMDDITFYKVSGDVYTIFEKSLLDHFYVEYDQIMSIHDNNVPKDVDDDETHVERSKGKMPWHLDRIDKKSLPLSNSYSYSETGSCHKNDVDISTYIVDTGIDVTHSEFEGRATWLANFADSTDTDCNSHGTHCAGIIGSKTYGVCKDANLFAIKVLDCRGSGTNSAVMKGIDFAFKTHLKREQKFPNKKVRGIMSMSLGGSFSRALNTLITNIVKKSNTFYITVAAGNENQDACNVSPASVKEIITVMASDKTDNRAYFSNWGECADIYAPGVNIESTTPHGQTAVYSGTSMACPATVGLLNHLIDLYPEANMKDLKHVLLKTATNGTIRRSPLDTPNMFVYLNRNGEL